MSGFAVVAETCPMPEERSTVTYSPETVYTFSKGETVFVYNDKHPFYHAKILDEDTLPEAEKEKFQGRHKVEYLGDKSTYWCLPKHLVKVFPDSVKVVICDITHDYRRMAHSQVFESDICLEIGCDMGECTRILAKRGKKAVGLDKSYESIQIAQDKFKDCETDLNFERVDVLKNPDFLEKFRSSTKVFIDINGSRPCETVEACLAIAQSKITSAKLFVVKSREMYRKHYIC